MEKRSPIVGQIMAAKLALDAARRMGDALRIDLAEASLNNLLERYSYHTSHTSQGGCK